MQKLVVTLGAAALVAAVHVAAAPPANFDRSLMADRSSTTLAPRSSAERRAAVQRTAKLKLTERNAPGRYGYPSNFDQHLGVSTFLWTRDNASLAIGPLKIEARGEWATREVLRQNASMLGLKRDTIDQAKLLSLDIGGNKPVIARYQQMKDGVEVFGRRLNVLMDRELRPVSVSGYFAPVDKTSADFSESASAAIAHAFIDMGGKANLLDFQPTHQRGGYTQYRARKSGADYHVTAAPRSRKVFYPLDGRLIPAYYVEIQAATVDGATQDYYAYVLAADDSKILFRKNLTNQHSYRTWADTSGEYQPFDGPLGNALVPLQSLDPAQVNPRTPAATSLVTLESGPISTGDPWLPVGATTTTGNNVDAYLDLGGEDGFDDGTADQRADVTSPEVFDYDIQANSDPSLAVSRNGAVVNLFYMNNWLHDFFYDNGFDEAAGNAQMDNYGRGGVDGDPIHAEGQDFSGRNNANMSTPADGGSPRMQQYLFDGPILDGELTITPASVGSIEFNTASFGPRDFDISGDVVLVDDGVAPNTNACESPLVNAAALSGKIVLIDRGACAFVDKAARAQGAGAIGVIIANNAAGAGAPGLGGTNPNITIPVLSTSLESGQDIKTALGNGTVSARMRITVDLDRDGTLDNGIIAHEFFHYVSNRLVNDASGLVNVQGRGMGEGWSDFATLLLIVRPEDRLVAGNGNYEGAYSTGVYVDDNLYFGIRRTPYSTDFDIDPLTFQHIEDGVPLPTTAPVLFGQNGASNSEVHNTGEIWANALWETYVLLLNDPRYTFVQARERMKDYLIGGLKLTPPAPTLLEARDSLLAVAAATDMTDFENMATAFAKRGMGVGAVAPYRFDETNFGVQESFVALAGGFELTDADADFGYDDGTLGYCDDDNELDVGETVQLSLTVRSNGTQDIVAPFTAQLSFSGDATFANDGLLTFPALARGEEATVTTLMTLNSAMGDADLETITVDFPDSGASVDAVIEAPSDSEDLYVNYDLQKTLSLDDVESTPATETDWTSELLGFGDPWVTTDIFDGFFGTGQMWWGVDNNAPSDLTLTSPAITVGDAGFSVEFDHYWQFELAGFLGDGTPVGFDGAVVEVSVDGGDWLDVLDAGATFAAGGYNGLVIVLDPENLRPGYTDFPDDLTHTVIDFGDAVNGSTVRLRFRAASDEAVGDLGWLVDNIQVNGAATPPFSQVIPEDGVCENRPPHVSVAATDITVPEAAGGQQQTITLSANVADQDGMSGLSYLWEQISGFDNGAKATVQLMNANTPTASFVAPDVTENQTLGFRFTVSDGLSSDSVDVNVTLMFVNKLPATNAGSDVTVDPGQTANLSGTATDPDGKAVTYAWTQTLGTPVTLTGANTAKPSFTAPSAAADSTLIFQLTATDADGGSSSDTVRVKVNPLRVESSSGGGALSPAWLLLALLAGGLRRRAVRRRG